MCSSSLVPRWTIDLIPLLGNIKLPLFYPGRVSPLVNYIQLINRSINQFYFANECIETGTWVTRRQITWVKINQIRLREPFEIQTIQPKKYLKWTDDFGYKVHMQPMLMNHKVILHTLTYWEIILSWLFLYCYNILSPIYSFRSPGHIKPLFCDRLSIYRDPDWLEPFLSLAEANPRLWFVLLSHAVEPTTNRSRCVFWSVYKRCCTAIYAPRIWLASAVFLSISRLEFKINFYWRIQV